MKKLFLSCFFVMTACLFTQAVLFAATPIVSVDTFIMYYNDRFDYSVEYPDLFQSEETSDLNDGIVFKSSDDKYELRIWGAYNVLEDNGNKLLEEIHKQVSRIVPGSAKSDVGYYTITYSGGGGMDGAEFSFYEYGIVNKTRMAIFRFRYPKEEDKQFAPLLERMIESLKIPDIVPDSDGYFLKEGSLYKKDVLVKDAVIHPVVGDGIGFWTVQGGDDSYVYLFNKESQFVAKISDLKDYPLQKVIPSPGETYVTFMCGSSTGSDMVYFVYSLEDVMNVSFNLGVRDEFEWLDPYRYVVTEIESNEEGKPATREDGQTFRLSVLVHDLAVDLTTILKKYTETTNFSLDRVDKEQEEIHLIETTIQKSKGSKAGGKSKTKIIKVPIPAAG